MDTWHSLLQSIVIDATGEWRKRLQACAIVIELELGLVMQINWVLFQTVQSQYVNLVHILSLST